MAQGGCWSPVEDVPGRSAGVLLLTFDNKPGLIDLSGRFEEDPIGPVVDLRAVVPSSSDSRLFK
jgi:hypothetical protein